METPKRIPLPSIWTGNYRDGGFPRGSASRRPTSLATTQVVALPMSPRAAASGGILPPPVNPAVMYPRHSNEDSVNEVGRSLVQSLNSGLARRLSGAEQSATPAQSPLSGAFDRMTMGGAPSVFAANTSLLLSGVSQPDVKSPVERRKSAVIEQKHPHSIFVTAVPLRRLSGGGMPVDESQPDRVVVVACVYPRLKGRSRFEMKRTFSLSQVRKSIAGPPRRLSTASSGSHPAADAVGRRRSSTIRPVAKAGAAADPGEVGHLPANTRQVYFTQARPCLPIIAALMLSGHLRDEDRIELPMPYPDAWPETFSYVTESLGELTEAVKKNILHLGGKV